jgi:hypothetical protein
LITLSIGSHQAILAGHPSPIVASAALGGGFGGEDESRPNVVYAIARPLSKEATKVWIKLQEKIPMAFTNETPLEDVLKYIRASTVEKADFPDGLPIYLDPVGFQEAEKTPTSVITINLKGIPLATCLKLLLRQLSLAYYIHPDGLVVITHENSEDIPIEAESVILDELSALRNEVRTLREEIRFSRGMPAGGGMYSGALPYRPESKPAQGQGSRGGMM